MRPVSTLHEMRRAALSPVSRCVSTTVGRPTGGPPDQRGCRLASRRWALRMAAKPASSFRAPERFVAFGIEALGYKHGVTLPLRLKRTDPAQGTRLDLQADLLVCGKVCIPTRFSFAATIPADPSFLPAIADTPIAAPLTRVRHPALDENVARRWRPHRRADRGGGRRKNVGRRACLSRYLSMGRTRYHRAPST